MDNFRWSMGEQSQTSSCRLTVLYCTMGFVLLADLPQSAQRGPDVRCGHLDGLRALVDMLQRDSSALSPLGSDTNADFRCLACGGCPGSMPAGLNMLGLPHLLTYPFPDRRSSPPPTLGRRTTSTTRNRNMELRAGRGVACGKPSRILSIEGKASNYWSPRLAPGG